MSAERPVLIDRFLADATEVDVDAIRDHTGEVLIGGVMEHVEEAGVHSGDSACAIPPQTLPAWVVEVIEAYTTAIAERLDVRGLINVQFAVAGTTVYVIEANPRASRTVPFVAKATGVPLAKVATRVMLGATLAELRAEGLARRAGRRPRRGEGGGAAVQPLPRGRPGARARDALDRRGDGDRHARSGGRSTRPSWRPARSCRPAARCSCRSPTPTSRPGSWWRRRLRELGLGIVATKGTAAYLATLRHARRPGGRQGPGRHDAITAVDLIADGKISFVVNTPQGRGGRTDGEQIRKAASLHRVSCVTTIAAALGGGPGSRRTAG